MKKEFFLISILIVMSTFFVGCSRQKTPLTKTGVYFDTVISITLYESNSSKLIDECFEIAKSYENLFSKTIPESDISRINNSNDWVQINKETFDLIESTFKYEELSGGKFSVVCGALVDLWDIPGRSAILSNNIDTVDNKSLQLDHFLPTDAEIKKSISLCGHDKINMDPSTNSVRINTNGASLDLGAVAKGYIADKMKEHLVACGVESGIIQLGGNVLTIGNNITKDDGLYHIGITKPFSDSNEVITSVATADESVVTSGNYQRYFEYNGKIYHHIIDLTTGYPADTSLNSVTVVCSSSTEADIMSTVLFLSGKNKGAELVDSLNLTNVVFIDSNNQILE